MRIISLVAGCAAICGCRQGVDQPVTVTFTGPFSGQFVESTVSQAPTGSVVSCTNSFTLNGTLSMTVSESGNLLTGAVLVTGAEVETGKGGDGSCALEGNRNVVLSQPISATPADLRFASGVSVGTTYTIANLTSFAGALSGGAVSGALTWSRSSLGTLGVNTIASSGSTTMQVTLR